MSRDDKHRGNPSTDAGAAFQRTREGVPPFGRIVEAEWTASGASQVLAHKLGREFVGAVVIGQTAGVTYSTSTPADTAANGYDASVELAVAPSASHTGALRLWVF